MVLSCVAGPGKMSLKEGFDSEHWINKAALWALKKMTDGNFMKYPFVPDSDERQYSSLVFS